MDRTKCAILAFAFAIAVSPGVFAQGDAAPVGDLQAELAHCLTFSGAVERLSCYDRLARTASRPAPRSANIPPPRSANVPPPPLPSRADAGAQNNPAQNLGREELPGARTAPQETRMTIEISEFRKDQTGRFTVALQNGQIWQQTAGDTAQVPYQIRPGQSVTIARGSLGSYDLTFVGHNISFKVKRLR